jgi:hypothetical protein
VGIAFRLETPAGIRFYTLSASPDRVQKVLDRAFKTGRIKGGYRDHDQALRVAWRVVKDWLEAQLALIEAAVVDLEQVMLPYLVVDEVGTTVYQRYLDQGRKAITG